VHKFTMESPKHTAVTFWWTFSLMVPTSTVEMPGGTNTALGCTSPTANRRHQAEVLDNALGTKPPGGVVTSRGATKGAGDFYLALTN
jgi:hypothetical protein